MKKLILVAAALLVALPVGAGTYSVTTTAGQDAVAERSRVMWNGAECSRLALPTNCSLAQATAKDAQTVYANTIQAWIFEVLKARIVADKAILDSQDTQTFQQAVESANTATKDSLCSTVGLAAGCIP